MSNYRKDIAQRSFNCPDCDTVVKPGEDFYWDNNLNRRICISCLPAAEKKFLKQQQAAPAKRQPKWNPSMLPTLPWHVGDYDINSWPPHIQQAYYENEKTEAGRLYSSGLKLGFTACNDCGQSIARAFPSKKDPRPLSASPA
jgi:hypothetical protein